MKQSEFKFLQWVEGVVVFVDRFITTSFYLAVRPHRFPDKWLDDSGRKSFVKPFNMTAISVFGMYLLLIAYLRLELIKSYTPSFTELPGNVSDYVDLPSLFGYAIPTIIVAFWLARLLSADYSRGA